MRTLLFVLSIQVFCMIMMASVFTGEDFRKGRNDWAKITAEQFR